MVEDSGAELGLLAFEAADGVAEFLAMRGQIGTTDVDELDVLQVLSDTFIEVQIGGVD